MRRRLPHVRAPGPIQHVIFCTRGAFTAHVDAHHPDRLGVADRALDASPAGRVLVAAAADAVADVLTARAYDQYALYAWCVMPNHVHVLMQARAPFTLDAIVQAWKSISARRVNRVLARTGPLWQANYFDRYMRDDEQPEATKRYIEMNPVVAKLCAAPHGWRWSSAWRD